MATTILSGLWWELRAFRQGQLDEDTQELVLPAMIVWSAWLWLERLTGDTVVRRASQPGE